jgi:hypothetical protein
MRSKQPRWTSQDFAKAESLIEAGATNEQCLEALGRTLKACSEKVRLGIGPQLYFKSAPATKVPEGVREEAAKRHMACPRDLTGMIFGDPPKGYSALERRS